jgi:predicted glutamine amidotransferase
MCRFLIVRSKKKINPTEFLNPLSDLSEKSVAPNGDRQWDGWGVSWRNNEKWEVKKSLKPMWEDKESFAKIPATNILISHARGSGFIKDTGEIEFNQPFIDGNICYVFNGTIYKVKLAIPLNGKIGSQKIFSLIKFELGKNEPEKALQVVDKLIMRNSEKVEGMNIGLVLGEKIYALNQYTNHENYYTLYYFDSPDLTMVSSEPFGEYEWKKFENGEVREF